MTRRYVIALAVLAVLLLLAAGTAGCVSNAARQTIKTGPSPTTTQPAVAAAAPQVAQQSGQGNLAGQANAAGWTGLEYTTAVPVGQVVLMALMLLFSHRREMARIQCGEPSRRRIDRGYQPVGPFIANPRPPRGGSEIQPPDRIHD